MKIITLFLSLFLLCSCSSVKYTEIKNYPVSQMTMEQMNRMYNPLVEKGFCLSSTGIYNEQTGTILSTPLPLCNRSDVVTHSHPFFGESEAMYFDLDAWSEYRKRYGNDMFGLLLGPNKLKVYVIE